jgi:hypothetical protein
MSLKPSLVTRPVGRRGSRHRHDLSGRTHVRMKVLQWRDPSSAHGSDGHWTSAALRSAPEDRPSLGPIRFDANGHVGPTDVAFSLTQSPPGIVKLPPQHSPIRIRSILPCTRGFRTGMCKGWMTMPHRTIFGRALFGGLLVALTLTAEEGRTAPEECLASPSGWRPMASTGTIVWIGHPIAGVGSLRMGA